MIFRSSIVIPRTGSWSKLPLGPIVFPALSGHLPLLGSTIGVSMRMGLSSGFFGNPASGFFRAGGIRQKPGEWRAMSFQYRVLRYSVQTQYSVLTSGNSLLATHRVESLRSLQPLVYKGRHELHYSHYQLPFARQIDHAITM